MYMWVAPTHEKSATTTMCDLAWPCVALCIHALSPMLPTKALPMNEAHVGGAHCHDLFPELSLTYLHSSQSSLVSYWVHYSSPSLSATHPTSPSRLHLTPIQRPIP